MSEKRVTVLLSTGQWIKASRFGHAQELLNAIDYAKAAEGFVEIADNSDTHQQFTHYVNPSEIVDVREEIRP